MTEPSHRIYHALPLLSILALGAFLLLFQLDHRPFWQDEAETANLARNVLIYGQPRAYDGVNIISQEQGKEYDQNFLWRWSPWLQIFVTAAAFKIGGLTTYAGRLPFALMGIACIWLVYQLIYRNFGDRAWACLAALLLATSVVFLLYARQCRYYSLGTLLTLINLYAFRENWQSKPLPALLFCLSLALLFYTNYLLFLSYVAALTIAAVLLYYSEIRWTRVLLLIAGTALLILPGLFLFRIQQQAMMVSLRVILSNLEQYYIDFLEFMFPAPLAAYMLWHWGRNFATRPGFLADPAERFILFISVLALSNIIILTPAPQCELRYLVHLYPLCTIAMAWVICRAWRYHKFSGALLGLLLLGTNWLFILPMDWLGIINRPLHNDSHMLSYPNIPLKLFLTELRSPYPDVNYNLVKFFRGQAEPGQTILTTYGDLPLEFYTSCQVIGGLQGHPHTDKDPDWLVLRWHTRWNRQYDLNDSEKLIRYLISQPGAYRQLTLPHEDEIFGNQPDPYFHRFIPPMESVSPLVIYEKNQPAQP
ncbi:MAG: ArnT family glycosyltransferase [Thermodesulfobacteriota bacterium]